MPEEPLVTRKGRVLTDADIQQLADEAERGYPTDERLARLLDESRRAERMGQIEVSRDEFILILADLIERKKGETDYADAGFTNRITFDVFECARDGGREHNPDRLKRWMIDHEDEIWDSIIGPTIDRVEDWYTEVTGDGS